MLVITASDGMCHSYYTYKLRFDYVGGCLLSRLPSKILDTLKYFCVYKFVGYMSTDPVLKALASHHCEGG